MKVLIFEGIATSGKSTIIQHLKSKLANDLKIVVADEEETHVPIMKKTDELHLFFYENLIDKLIKAHPDLLILDRLYLTQAFRAKVDLAAYTVVEEKLMPYSPLTVFLKVEPDNIKERVQKAIEHRDAEWGQYVASKGETPEQQALYYIDQQESQLELLKQSTLPYKIFDTTSHNYDKITDEIIGTLGLR